MFWTQGCLSVGKTAREADLETALLALFTVVGLGGGYGLVARMAMGPAKPEKIRRDSHYTAIALSLALWVARLRRVNGPNFTWPLVQFSGMVPGSWLARADLVYAGRPLPRRPREELLATVRADWREAIALARQGGTRAPRRRLAVLQN